MLRRSTSPLNWPFVSSFVRSFVHSFIRCRSADFAILEDENNIANEFKMNVQYTNTAFQ